MLSRSKIKSTSNTSDNRLFFCLTGLALMLLAAPAFGQHIHQLFSDNDSSWVDNDISTLAGGPAAAPGVTSFYTAGNDQLHVYYFTGDYHVHQLYFNGTSWSDQDLTVATGGVVQMQGATAIGGFSIANAQYVYFCGDDAAIHEYSYGNNGNFSWVDAALPTGVGGTCLFEVPEALVAFATTPNNQRHVYYGVAAGKGADIYQLYFNGSSWSNQDLTKQIKGAKQALRISPLSGFANGNHQYVFFESLNGHVQQYSYANSWTSTDLTKASAGVPGNVSGGMIGNGATGFAVPGTTQIEVYYAATKTFDVQRLTFQNNKWTDTNLSALTGGPSVGNGAQILGFASAPSNQLNVFYFPALRDLYQLLYTGTSWSDEQLPSVAGNSPAGFALNTGRYVYYVSAN